MLKLVGPSHSKSDLKKYLGIKIYDKGGSRANIEGFISSSN